MKTEQAVAVEKCNSADGVVENGSNGHHSLITHLASSKMNTQSLPRIGSNGNGNMRRVIAHSRTASLTRDGNGLFGGSRRQLEEEDEVTTPTEDCSAPPKPNRSMMNLRHGDSTLTLKDLPIENGPLNRVVSYHASGSDSGNGSGDSAQSSTATDIAGDATIPQPNRAGGVIIRNPKFMPNSSSTATLKSYSDFDYQMFEERLLESELPIIEQTSRFDLENFSTLLLPSIENKPLDASALNSFRIMLGETASRIIANHMTRVDIQLILDDFDKTKTAANESDGDVFKSTGLELITLSHGEQYRKDIIERTECIRLLVAVTILTCADDDERAETLNKWIQIAIDTKTALGNLYGFSNLMLGLCMPQVQKLESTWHLLRQKYTDSAFNFEAKLRPTLTNMNNCTNPQAPNTTVPHLLPYVLLKDRSINDFLGESKFEQQNR